MFPAQGERVNMSKPMTSKTMAADGTSSTFRPPSPESINRLSAIPWCAKMLSDSTLKPFQTPNRTSKLNTEDSLMAETLATDKTVQIWQAFHRPPSPDCPRGEYLFIAMLGTGLNGHAGMLHGGMVGMLMDECMGTATYYTMLPERNVYTVTMTVNFKKPVTTPNVVLIRTWLDEKSDGRKMFPLCTMEDGEGGIYAIGSSVYIVMKSELKL